MASHAPLDEHKLHRARLITTIGGTFVALASGTNYVYSAYAPQLASKLRITHTQLNIVGLSGNVGVYLSGPIWGRIVDRQGPRILFALGSLMLLLGYAGIKSFFDNGDSRTALSTAGIVALSFCSFFTGFGGNGGLTGSMNANAKSWPDKQRATTNGIVISGFGLSAFLFSTLARVFFEGHTSSLLLVLALGTSIPVLLGFFFVKPIPHNERDNSQYSAQYTVLATEGPPVFDEVPHPRRDHSRTRLLGDEESVEDLRNSVELRRSHSRGISFPRISPTIDLPDLDISGKELFRTWDFWLLTTIMFLLSGTGLMYINNVGSMVQALLAHADPKFDEVEGLKRQANQVAIISLCNFSGRIIIGVGADIAKHTFGSRRSFGLTLVALGFVLSQIIASSIVDIDHLWRASAVLGLAYGMLFGLYPTVVIEWFGLSHFSENWGFVSVAPAFGGNLFSLAFGRNLDAHDPTLSKPSTNSTNSPLMTVANATTSLLFRSLGLPTSGDDDNERIHRCVQGRECYVDTLYLAALGCAIAFVLAIYAGWRDVKTRSHHHAS